MSIGSIVEGTHRSRFLAVISYICKSFDAFESNVSQIGLDDGTVRIMSLEPNTCLELKSTQALPTKAESLNILEVVLMASSLA